MPRGGRQKDRAEPERRCIVTGETGPAQGLIRFVAGPDGAVVPDILGRLPGRGMWVTADRAILEQARKGQFARAARAAVTVPDDIAGTVEAALARRVTDLIALARKAGMAVAGFEKVKDRLAAGGVRVLLQAHDGSSRGKSKLWTPQGARYFDCLGAEELGLAFGRQSVIHAALTTGGLADRVVEEAARLKGLRQQYGGTDAAGKD